MIELECSNELIIYIILVISLVCVIITGVIYAIPLYAIGIYCFIVLGGAAVINMLYWSVE